MNPFQRLVKRAERECAGAKNRLGRFPEIATRLLQEFEYGLSQERLDESLARWMLEALPEQVSLHNTFGQPPLTLFNNGWFVLDLYFWVTCDTSIHSHGFRGAFRVLHGRSLHETYRMKVSRRIAPGVMRCDPGVPRMELMETGDVHTILPGEKLTHRVIHLEKPTVTLCLKTINEPGLYQWEHFPDGLAVQRRDLTPGLIKRIYYFEYLLGQNATRADRYLEKVVGSLSVVARMTLYEALCGGAFDLSEDALERGLGEIRKRHGTSDWFKRHECPVPLHLKELHFSACETSLERLAAHFINRRLDAKTAAPYLSRLAGRPVTRSDVQRVAVSLMDHEPVFGCELSIDDRATIKELVERPAQKIPEHLRPFGQIPAMRDFIASFP
ncbi:MAG TPA: hypothetical protein VF950_25145 [Planctomycetota bacterium]